MSPTARVTEDCDFIRCVYEITLLQCHHRGNVVASVASDILGEGNMRKNTKYNAILRAGASALFLVVATGWTTGGHSLAAYADTLTADQVSAVQGLIQTALANIDPSLTGTARQQAVASALAQATTGAIQIYGTSAIATLTSAAVAAGVPVAQVVVAVLPAAAAAAGVSVAVASVTLGATAAGASPTQTAEAVIVTATQAQYASADVGSGLGAAAAQLSATNTGSATQIATVISNEGTAGMGSSFSAAVVQNGGSQQLANVGTQNPNATGETGGTTSQTVNNQTNTNTPTCTNPSCT